MDLSGKVVLITGASAGLGKELAQLLAGEAKLALLARRMELLEARSWVKTDGFRRRLGRILLGRSRFQAKGLKTKRGDWSYNTRAHSDVAPSENDCTTSFSSRERQAKQGNATASRTVLDPGVRCCTQG